MLFLIVALTQEVGSLTRLADFSSQLKKDSRFRTAVSNWHSYYEICANT